MCVRFWTITTLFLSGVVGGGACGDASGPDAPQTLGTRYTLTAIDGQPLPQQMLIFAEPRWVPSGTLEFIEPSELHFSYEFAETPTGPTGSSIFQSDYGWAGPDSLAWTPGMPFEPVLQHEFGAKLNGRVLDVVSSAEVADLVGFGAHQWTFVETRATTMSVAAGLTTR